MTVMCEPPRDNEEVEVIEAPKRMPQDKVLKEIEKIGAGKVEAPAKPKEVPAEKPFWYSQADIKTAKRVGQKEKEPQEEIDAAVLLDEQLKMFDEARKAEKAREETRAQGEIEFVGCEEETRVVETNLPPEKVAEAVAREEIRQEMERQRKLNGDYEKTVQKRNEVAAQKHEHEKSRDRPPEQKNDLSGGTYEEKKNELNAKNGIINETFERKLESLEATVEKESEKVEELVEPDANVGKKLSGSGYKITRKIGEGGLGVLYEAEADVTGRRVVLKGSNNDNIAEGSAKILGEVEVNKLLDHPNIISIESVAYDENKRVYAQMPFVKGAKKLDYTEKRSLKNIAETVKKLAKAHAHAHKRGVLHRDIKAENTLIDATGEPFVIDFGVSKVDEKVIKDKKLKHTLTETGYLDARVAGTIKDMAPEILEGDEPSPVTEVYSLGRMLYKMVMQDPKAVPIGNVEMHVLKKAATIVDPKSEKYVACTRLARVIAKATDDKENRHQTMKDFATDLEALINDLPDEIVEQKTAKEEQKTGGTGFFITEDDKYYHLHNVSSDGKLWDYSWTKELLNGGRPATQEVHVKQTKNTKEKLASLPVYNASITAVVKHRKNSTGKQKELAERVCQMFAGDFNRYNMMTSTRVAKVRKQPIVTHDWGYDTAEETNLELVASGFITADCGLKKVPQTLLKTQNCAEIEQTYEELTGKKPYLAGHFSQERAVVLGREVNGSSGINWFVIGCNDYIDGIFVPARGVVVTQKNLEEKVNSPIVSGKNQSTKYVGFESKVRGLDGTDNFLIKAGEYATHLNDILTAFGSALEIVSIDTMHFRANSGERKFPVTSLNTLYNHEPFWVCSSKAEDGRETYISINVASKDKKIAGYINFIYNYCGGDYFSAELIPSNVTVVDEPLLDAINYFSQEFSKAPRFNKRKLEKAGFTRDYAIKLFDREIQLPSRPKIEFVRWKKLYDIDGRYLGSAYASDGLTLPATMYFKKGWLVTTSRHAQTANELIDLGDRYLLKP